LEAPSAGLSRPRAPPGVAAPPYRGSSFRAGGLRAARFYRTWPFPRKCRGAQYQPVPCQRGHRFVPKRGAAHTLDQPVFILLSHNSPLNQQADSPQWPSQIAPFILVVPFNNCLVPRYHINRHCDRFWLRTVGSADLALYFRGYNSELLCTIRRHLADRIPPNMQWYTTHLYISRPTARSGLRKSLPSFWWFQSRIAWYQDIFLIFVY